VKGLHKPASDGLLNHKHIPMAYLRASEAQRRALVQGLMDSDGFHTRSSDGIDLCNKQLAHDVCELFRSLGLVVRMARATPSSTDGSPAPGIASRFDSISVRSGCLGIQTPGLPEGVRHPAHRAHHRGRAASV